MKKIKSEPYSKGIRERAEEFIKKNPSAIKKVPPGDVKKLIEDLQIHQVELEMQNEELRRAQLELEAARDKYSDLYDFAPVGYFTISDKGMILEANLTMASMLGAERGSMIGNPFSRFINRDDQDIYYHLRRKVIKTRNRQVCELRLVHEDGSQIQAQMECILSLDENGALVQTRIAVTDITVRKQAEEEKTRLEAHLSHAQQIEAIAVLAGGIAHQFNNALVPITGNLDLLTMDYPNDKNISRYVEQMRDSAQKIAHLTDQLLAYAKGGKYQAKIVDLSNFVGNTLPLIGHSLKPSLHIEKDLSPDISRVKADLTQIQMVLTAILSNASEAIEGEGRIKISAKNQEIDEPYAKNYPGLKPGSYVSLTIEDDGTGMDEDTKRRVFEPFFTTKFQGRGLGMAAVFGIIKNHNGWISVDSELGKGTAVRIFLPAIEAKLKEFKKPKGEPPKGMGTILVIEDEEMVLDVCQKLLKRLGYRVLGAKTGNEAVNIAKTFDGDIDLAMLDVVLPDMGGEAIYPLIMKARPNLKVIVFSGYSIDGPAQEILNKGAQDYIQKPFTIAEISKKLKTVLGG